MIKHVKKIGMAAGIAGILVLGIPGCTHSKDARFQKPAEGIETQTIPHRTEGMTESDSAKSLETALETETVKKETAAETDTIKKEMAAETDTEPETAEPADEELVRVTDYIPTIVVELKYATEDNFTGTVIYDFKDAYLRYGTVKKLAEAEKEFETKGMRIKIWDAYRPVEAQERLWEVYPDPVYVADPSNGITSHSRGDTIDCTLVYMDGSEVEMPTGFDDFSTMADRYYDDCSAQAAANAAMMEEIMYAHGFTGYEGEWWDYSDTTLYQ